MWICEVLCGDVTCVAELSGSDWCCDVLCWSVLQFRLLKMHVVHRLCCRFTLRSAVLFFVVLLFGLHRWFATHAASGFIGSGVHDDIGA